MHGITIYSEDKKQHIIDLEEIFGKLRAASVTLKRGKCHFIK